MKAHHMQTHRAVRSSSSRPRRISRPIEVDPVKLGRVLAGLTGRGKLTDEEYAKLASEWAEALFGKIAT